VRRTPTERRARRWLPLSVAAVATVVHHLVHLGFTMDDSAISYGYARSFADGLGLGVLQEGAGRVEGYSNTVWVLMLATGEQLGIAGPTTAKALALVLPLATIAVFFDLLRRLTDDPRSLWAGCVLAVAANVAVWDASGLETPLHLFLLVAAARLLIWEDDHPLRPWPLSAVVLVLAVLTRIDAGAFLAVAALFKLLRVRRRLGERQSIVAVAAWFAVVAVLLGSYLVWHRHHFGTLVPNTATAKGGGLSEVLRNATPPSGEGVRYVGSWLLTAAGLALVPAMAVGAVKALRSPPALLVTLFAAAALVLPLAEPDWMREHRFMTTFAVFGVALVALGVDALLQAFAQGHLGRRAVALVLVPIAVFGLVNLERSVAARRSGYRSFVTVSEVRRSYEPLASAARLAGLGDPLYAVPDIGGTSFRSDMRVVDLVGLADYHAARTLDEPRLHAAYVIDERRPHLLDNHGPWEERTGSAAAAVRSGRYEDVQRSTEEGMYGGQEERRRVIRRDVLVRAARDHHAPVVAFVPDAGLAGARLPVEVLWRGAALAAAESQRTRLIDAEGSVVVEDVELLGHGWVRPDEVRDDERLRQTVAPDLPERTGPYRLEVVLLDQAGRTTGPAVEAPVAVVADRGRAGRTIVDRARARWADGDPVAAMWFLEWGSVEVPRVDLGDDVESLRRDILDRIRARARADLVAGDVVALQRATTLADEVRGRSPVGPGWDAVGRACTASSRAASDRGDDEGAYRLALCAGRLRPFEPEVAEDLVRARNEFLS
jgi:hypothetical protein